jgi:hypothetical protein
MMNKIPKDASFTFRLPAAVKEAIERAAEDEQRSAAQYALIVLVDHLVAEGRLTKPSAAPGRADHALPRRRADARRGRSDP